MKKKITKALSVMLTVVLTFTASPLSGFVGLELPELLDVSIDASAETSGTCGTNLTWSFDESTGTLTISGTGEMDNYSSYNRPWENYVDSIKTVVIEEGVTSIGEMAFYSFGSLTSITIPDSVTSLGYSAFYDCRGLVSVTIGDGVTSLGYQAFYYCTSLVSVTIPDSVMTIGNSAFSNCTSLASIIIPDSVTSIGSHAFNNCESLTSITVDSDNEYYSSDEYGVLFNKDKTSLIQYPTGNARNSYIIPDNVTRISGYAFIHCTSLTSITIPDSVITIGDYAFYNCTSLASIIIPDSVTTIGGSAFSNCNNLISVTIPDSVTTIGYGAFQNCTSITSIAIPNSVTFIGERAFSGCTSLTNITIGDSVATIGYAPFENCKNITSIMVDSNNEEYSSDEYGVLFNKDKTELMMYPVGNIRTSYTIPNSVISIGNNAFRDCTSLTNITIPNSVTSIGNCAFDGCTSLTNIKIPNSVISMGNWVFSNCTSSTSITIGNSVTAVGYAAFEKCANITNITIPSSVTSIGNESFRECSSLTSVVISDNATSIGDRAFLNCSSLTSITIPDKVTSIGDSAFSDCTSLTSVTIGDGVTTIESRAFDYCTSLTSVTIGDSLMSIGYCAFYYCQSLTDVYYSGTEEQWNEITIDDYNECLTNATIHYNSTGPDSGDGNCSECGGTYEAVVTEPTCESMGYTTYTCSLCQNTYDADATEALGHDMQVIADAVAPTCELTGSDAVMGCTRCDHIEGGHEIAATGHDMQVTTVAVAPSCEDYGVTAVYTCANGCGKTEGGESIPATGHSYNSNVTAPTCTKQGYTTYICSVCYDNYISDYIDALGHNFIDGACEYCGANKTSFYLISSDENPSIGDIITVEVGILNNTGIGALTIDVVYDSTVLKALSVKSKPLGGTHNIDYDENKVRYLNVVSGEITDTGTVLTIEFEVLNSNACEMYIDFVEIVDADYAPVPVNSNVLYLYSSYCENDEHKYTTVLTEPTCIKQGYTTYICSLCGDSYVSNYIDALGYHSYNSFVTEPTCTEQGYTTYTCSDCGDTYTTDEVSALGHNYVDSVCEYCGERSENPSGNCGENVTWTFNPSTGTLTISGTGEMESYWDWDEYPWKTYKSDIISIVINDGITTLGEGAFAECTNLTSVTLPDSVTTIGEGAFAYCEKLISVTIPDSVVIIGDYAFYDCTSLKNASIGNSVTIIGEGAFGECYNLENVVIPDSVETIEESAFAYCQSLTNVLIPESVISIGMGAFGACENLTKITVESNNEYYSNDEYGILYNKDKTTLISYPAGNINTEYEIFDSVTTIGGAAFAGCCNLSSVTISNSVITIGESAFFECTGLANITIPYNVTTIGAAAFSGCISLATITIPDGVTSIEYGAFYGCTNLTSITIPDSVTVIGSDAFGYCTSLASITIPNGITTVSEGAFEYCTSLTDVYYSGMEEQWNNISIENNNDPLLNATIHYNYHSHIYEADVTAPTCTEQGYTTYTCSVCDNNYISDYVEALGHTEADAVEENYLVPTCTEKGSKDSVVYCSVCDEELSRETIEIEALGHTYESIVTAPTCTEQGYTTYTCSICDHSYDDDYTEALGHTEAEAVEENYLAPTCTEKGSKDSVVYCSVCDYELSRETIEIEALGHTYESTIVAPTCTEQGYTKYTCSVCDDSYNDNYTEAYGHNYNSIVTAPSCTEDGYTTYTCSACNDSYMSDIVVAYGHNYDMTVVEATCTKKGYTKYVCSNCNNTYTDNYVDEKGHYYTATVTEATCTKQGYTSYVCSTCNDSYKDNYVEALGHNLRDWEIIKSATILNEGERTRSCSACDYSEKEILDKITVDINSNENYGLANFTVVNAQTLEPIKNANIFVSTENDGENTFATDENGKVSIILPIGKQNISVYANGCLTRNLKINIKSGTNDIPQIGLSDKPTYEAELTTKEMTLEEIKEAGIDTTAPGNQHVFKYELKLEFDAQIDWFSLEYYKNENDKIVGSNSGDFYWIPGESGDGSGYFYNRDLNISIRPITEYFYLIIRGEVTWLKEMFDVEMLVVNNSMTDTLEDLTATLTLPEGLSLADMIDGEQTLTQYMGDVTGGKSKTAHWYVRGDKAGRYSVEARLQGMVMPFEEPIDDLYHADNQINVYAGNAMHLHFEFPNAAYHAEDYPITITLENVSDKTLYNVSHKVQIEQGMSVFYSNGTSKTEMSVSEWETIGVEEFNPGDKIIIEASVNILFESEIIQRQLDRLKGVVDGVELLVDVYKIIDLVGTVEKVFAEGISEVLEVLVDELPDIDDKIELYDELKQELSALNEMCAKDGNDCLQVASILYNSYLYGIVQEISIDPVGWIMNTDEAEVRAVINAIRALRENKPIEESYEKKFDIFDSIRTAISAIPVKFALMSVIMTTDENSTTEIPWSYTAYDAGEHYFGVSNVSKYIQALATVAAGEVYSEIIPPYLQLLPGLDDPLNMDEAVEYIQATEKEIELFKAKDATGNVTFRAWVERNVSPYSRIGNNKSDDFILECDNKSATYEDGVLTFTGDGMISVIPQNQNGGTLYIEDSEGNVYTYVIDVVEQHECEAGDMQVVLAPTSEFDGYAVKHCNTCGEIMDVIPLAYEDCCETHKFTEWTIETGATGTESGITTRYCTLCGYTEYQFVDYEEHVHSYGEWSITNEATCTDAGTKARSCTDCGEEETVTISALGHDYSDEWTIDVEATCKATGSKSHHCTRCDAQTDVTEIPAGEHTLEHVVVSSSCSVVGVEYDICLICQEMFNYTILSLAEHSYGKWTTETEASCTSEGTRIRLCSVCGNQETETIPSTGHTLGEIVVENEVVPSCMSNGSYDEVVYCTVCNTELSRNTKTVEKMAHSYTSVVTAPTCTTNGYTTYTCICGDTYTSNETNALGHNEVVDEAVEATCAKAGLTEGSHCDVCGEILVAQEETVAIGHQFSEWSETKAPSYLADGQETRVCSICNENETRPIDALIPDKTYNNEETDVSISVTDETYSGEIEVNVTPIYDGESYQVINSEIGNFNASIFDITTTIDGEKVQPEGKVLVKMPIPAGYNPKKIVVYYIPNDGSAPEKMDIIIEGNYVLFETDHFSNYAIIDTSEINATISIQYPSRTEIRNKDGIILHANVEGTAPAGSYIRWESSNGNFDKSADGSNLKIIAKNKGYTTFTAILCDADGNELARDTVEMYSKSGFFDKIGGFFRSLFGTTKIYEY